MKYCALLFFLLVPVAGICISVEEIGRLAELKTGDDLILQLIQQEEIDRPLTARDVIYLRERGLSEKIIDSLWKQSIQDKEFLPPQEGESTMIDESLRSYNGIDKSGNKIVVLTNLDENGRRMGPPPPPAREPEPQLEITYEPQQSQEIYLSVRHEEPAWASQEEDLQRYQPQPFGIPMFSNGYNPFYTFSFFPVIPFNPHCTPGKSIGNRHNSRPLLQPSQRVNVHGPVRWPGSAAKTAKRH